MRIPVAFLLVSIFCVAGCASLSSDRHARELADNRADDEYCAEHDLRYPDPGYVQCRRQLVDRRLYRDWQSLRLMQRANQPVGNPSPVPQSTYRNPNPASFHCHAEPQFGGDYVFCGYEDTDPRPR